MGGAFVSRPDAPARATWRRLVTEFLIGLYIGKQGLESTYGAAASIVVVLIWVYYSAPLVPKTEGKSADIGRPRAA
jgi:hypothetical protein